jgi:transposase
MMLFVGIDWSSEKHDICICSQEGARLSQFTIKNDYQGYHRLVQELRMLGVPAPECMIGIETDSLLLVDYLQDRSYSIYVVPPSATEAYRQIQRTSGAIDDSSDAALLAWVMRVDRRDRYRSRPNSLLTQQLLIRMRSVHKLGMAIQSHRAQLNSALTRAYPAALAAFKDLSQPNVLRFLAAYPTMMEAQELSLTQFTAICRSFRYFRKQGILDRYGELQQSAGAPPREVQLIYRDQVEMLAQTLIPLVQLRDKKTEQLHDLFLQHPDHEIFASLPGAGKLLAPSLLAKFGDHRERFPEPGNVQALAGTCPITKRSGKKQVVVFRKHCNREFRRIAQQFAVCSLTQSSWARAYWHEIRPGCDSDSHAHRIVANRWLAIIWALWQKRELYDEQYHLRQRMKRRKPIAA